MNRRRQFKRVQKNRRYKKLYIIATEGTKTEPDYFKILQLQSKKSVIRIHCLSSKSSKNSPKAVLKRMNEFLEKENVLKGDEAWLVVDKDSWKEEHLHDLFIWAKEANKNEIRNIAISNPKFEYWLLLHFEDAKEVTSQNCTPRLKKYLKEYNKNIRSTDFTLANVQKAIERAKHKNSNNMKKWPEPVGSTVYLLVESILKNSDK